MIGLDLQGDGLFSNVGVAACVPVKPPSSVKGAQTVPRRLRLPVRDEAHRPDVGQLRRRPVEPGRARRQGRPVGARRAGRGRRAFDVRSGLPGLVLEVSGADAPPSVTLTGPSGDGRSARPARRGRAHHLPRRGRAACRALAPDARARLVRRDGGPARRRPAGAEREGARERPRARAHPALDPAGAARPGRALRRGGPRRARRAIVTTGKARGSKRFRARGRPRRAGGRSWPSSSRRAWSRERIVAGRYAAPAPQRPARPKGLALRRRGGALDGALEARRRCEHPSRPGAALGRAPAAAGGQGPLAADPGLRPARDRDGLGARPARGLRRARPRRSGSSGRAER